MIKIIEKISATLSYIIFSWSVLTYVIALLQQPIEKMANIGLSAFALVAAVSGLCFAMAAILENDNGKSTAIYAGEKLLHSTVLILQTIVLKYALDTLMSSDFMKSHETLTSITSIVSHVFLSIVSSYAAYFSLYGFEALHDFLWNRFHIRRESIKCK